MAKGIIATGRSWIKRGSVSEDGTDAKAMDALERKIAHSIHAKNVRSFASGTFGSTIMTRFRIRSEGTGGDRAK